MLSIPIYIRRILFFLYLLVIAWASLSPPDDMPRLISIPYFDKAAHFMMYLIFCIAGIWALDKKKANTNSVSQEKNESNGSSENGSVYVMGNEPFGPEHEDRQTTSASTQNAGKGWMYAITFLFAIAWGLGMELFQRAMHLGREYSVADLAANITGALTGAGLYYFLFERRRQNSKQNSNSNRK